MNESKATRFQRNRRRTQALGVASGGVLLGVLAFTPLGPALAGWSRIESGPGVFRYTLSLLFYLGLILVAWEILLFAAVRATSRADRSEGRGLSARDAHRSQVEGLFL